MKGKFTIAGGTLGPLADTPMRTLEALRKADLVVFEEDRMARRYLKAAGVHKDYLRFSEHEEVVTHEQVTTALDLNQHVVYMSDQGMPTIADPGHQLTSIAFAKGAMVEVIPGPSALTSALAACPFDCNGFSFVGYLPRSTDLLAQRLLSLRDAKTPVVVFEAPYRRRRLLRACLETLGPGAKALIAMDISGPAERFLYGTIAEIVDQTEGLDKNLNFVLVLQHPSR